MTAAALQISDVIYAELTATCDALGYNDGNKFLLDKNAIEVLKDLIRYLKRDDDIHSVRRYLGHSKLLQRDLLKIFVEHVNKTELWNVLLRLLINLTSPALMVYNEELPSEKITRSYYLQILSHLQEYKSAMANDAVWGIIHEKMKNILTIESEERGEENEMIMERILTLIRNVLRVPASDSENRTDNDTSIHDEVLFALNTTGVTELLVYIASSSKEQQYHMQILEIIAFMLQGQNPARLARVGLQRSNHEKEAEEARLVLMRQKEQAEKLAKMKKYAGSSTETNNFNREPPKQTYEYEGKAQTTSLKIPRSARKSSRKVPQHRTTKPASNATLQAEKHWTICNSTAAAFSHEEDSNSSGNSRLVTPSRGL